MRLRVHVLVVVLLAGLATLLQTAPASAHAARKVGNYFVVLGWGDEPAYTGFKNSVQLILTDLKEHPVVDLGDTLSVEVTFGSEKKTLKFEPNFEVGEFGTEGDYRAWLTPTSAGSYTLHLTGSIKKQKVDLTVASGEETFSSVDDQADVQFPQKVPNGADLSARIDREIPRVESKLSAKIGDTDDTASQARLLGIIGVALGAIAVVLGGVGLARKR